MTAPWIPGGYIARRRQVAGLSLDAVAARFSTEPPFSERDRRWWLATIEADVIAVPDNIGALLPIFRFDPVVLAQLVQHRADPAAPMPRICRICACSEHDPCVRGTLACAWVADEDLCTACAMPDAPAETNQTGASTC